MEQEQNLSEETRRARAVVQSALLDDILRKSMIKNDAVLSRMVEMSPPVISKLRNGHLPVGPGMLIALSEVTGRSIKDMKQALGMKVLSAPAPEGVVG